MPGKTRWQYCTCDADGKGLSGIHTLRLMEESEPLAAAKRIAAMLRPSEINEAKYLILIGSHNVHIFALRPQLTAARIR